jgi:serine protease AprX
MVGIRNDADWGHKGRVLKMNSVGMAAARVLGAAIVGMLAACSVPPSNEAVVSASPEPAQSYIVEGQSTDAAADAVKDAGGRVTSRLGVIDAVEADLTDAQHALVLKAAGIKQITTNSIVMTNAAANVLDRFETASFANNDGTHRWYGDWIEQDNNSPFDGQIAMGWPMTSGKHLIIGGHGSIQRRAATPSSSPTVTLKFRVLRGSLEAGDYVSVQASGNAGATWAEVGRIAGPANDSAFATKSYDITAYRGRNTAIRFVSSMDQTYAADYLLVDDVELAYTTTFGAADAIPVDVNAAGLHAAGIRGKDVGVAVIDTGYWKLDSLDLDTAGTGRVGAQFDAIRNVQDTAWSTISTDTTGHGTHVTSVIASSRKNSVGRYFGVAPDARIISVKAFDETGKGTYATVIRGIDWVIANRLPYGIRILNLSLGAPAQSRYWDDPLNKAVMKAWQAGIVVVASAGNAGPEPQTVGVPGNVPYVITVGAMTDNYTASGADDRLASFSSAGPTFEGFVKPDLVAPGGHVWGFMGTYMKIAVDHPTFINNGDFFQMSGTSQSAAVVSGVAALVLSQNPSLTPDQVKCRIMASGKPAVDSKGALAYSVLQQGTGLVDANKAVNGSLTNCANVGLNINYDLAGIAHYKGAVRQQSDGTFVVTGSNGGTLTGSGFIWNSSYLWQQGFIWNSGYIWNNGYIWNASTTYGADIQWVGGYPSAIGSTAGTASSMSINSWVAPE